MAAMLALFAALMFALAAALQQKGALTLGEISLRNPKSIALLAGQRMWLLGTLALLTGYVLQAAALDRGRLAIIQPLLVTTVVFALPLGYFLTNQHITRRQVGGALVILVGLAAFALFGDPAGGRDSAPFWEWAIVFVVVGAACGVLLAFGARGGPSTRAAVYGTASGMLFGLSAALTKPTVELLHEGIGVMLEHWEPYALAFAGILGFVLQQVSLGTGRLAPSVATVSVANPVVGIAIGVALLEERLSRPAWHIVVAVIGLVLALVGAVVISISQEAGKRREPERAEPGESVSVPA
jgi:drug/metabolite transporter (DMT)-like permease